MSIKDLNLKNEAKKWRERGVTDQNVSLQGLPSFPAQSAIKERNLTAKSSPPPKGPTQGSDETSEENHLHRKKILKSPLKGPTQKIAVFHEMGIYAQPLT